jgi:hypothetical protein
MHWLRWADTIAHVLYHPLRGGRRGVWRYRWYLDSIHLIPGTLLSSVCDRYEARLLAAPHPDEEDPGG